ncbi:MAG TPA: hypothetical protein VG228_00070, partial [Solirubrobacteraceae bacterium]|nr:hypothetical protein [Solirubrobacteraceae bacterium]
MRSRAGCLLAPLIALAIFGCGSSSSSSSSLASSKSSQTAATSSTESTTSSTAPVLPPAVNELATAQRPSASQFPSPRGRSLQQLGQLVKSSAELGAATGTFTPGTRRLAFGLTTSSGAFIYAPTAVYIAKTASSPAQGPYLAPADPMSVLPQYRSKENSGPGGIKAIYAAQLPI